MKINPSQIERGSHIAFDTQVGTKMSLKWPGQEKRIWTRFVGMETDRYILLRQPQELSDGSVVGSKLTVEYVNENLVFGFSAAVLNAIRKPFPLLFLEYPSSVERLDLRTHNRAICFLPVTLFWESEQYPGHIIDLSRSGARVAVDLAAARQLSNLDDDSSLFAQFSLDGLEEIYAKCGVRNLTRDRQKLFIGVKFMELPQETEQQIELYVQKINEFRIG